MIRSKGDKYEVVVDGANGKKKYVGLFGSKREAKEREQDAKVTERRIKRGELPAEMDTKRRLGDALDTWLAHLERSGARSHRAYGEFVKYQIRPKLGTAALASVTTKHVKRWRDDLKSDYAASSINSAIGCLSSAFAWFASEGWCASNPCHGVEQIEIPKKTYNWIRTRGELERLLLACSDELRDIVAVAVGTGMRIDELLHLQWTDVDLGSRLVCVQRGRQGPTKGGEPRWVPILDSVLPVLQRRALRRGGHVLVFPSPQGRVRAKTPVTVAFKQALGRAGLDTKVRFHDLRHTAASWWVMAGGDIFRLSKLLGHKNVSITQKTYAHLAPEAWTQDYARITFHVPSEPAKVVEFVRGEDGKLAGRRTLTVESRWNPETGAAKTA